VTSTMRDGDIKTRIHLAESRTCFGGRRVWLQCPKCMRRRRVLFVAPQGRIACRRCFRLRYFSQSQDVIGRAEHAMSKIVQRLKADGSGSDDLPPKPMGMHWSRYDRLADRFERQSNIWTVATMRRLGVLIPRLRGCSGVGLYEQSHRNAPIHPHSENDQKGKRGKTSG
jgi:hypothetical protein